MASTPAYVHPHVQAGPQPQPQPQPQVLQHPGGYYVAPAPAQGMPYMYNGQSNVTRPESLIGAILALVFGIIIFIIGFFLIIPGAIFGVGSLYGPGIGMLLFGVLLIVVGAFLLRHSKRHQTTVQTNTVMVPVSAAAVAPPHPPHPQPLMAPPQQQQQQQPPQYVMDEKPPSYNEASAAPAPAQESTEIVY